MKQLFTILLLLVSLNVWGQASISVASYGAVGDATNFTVTTTYGSPVVSSSIHWPTNSTIGKVIEVFSVRTNSYISPIFGYFTNNTDIICYVTDVVNETNLYLSQICQVSSNAAVCIVGSNNQTNFQNAILAAGNLLVGGVTNVTINIPTGNYLLVNGTNQLSTTWQPPNYATTFPVLYINSGGLTFKGVGTNTVLLGCGAAVPRISAANDNNGVFRGSMFWVEAGATGSVTNNQYPLVFQDMIVDGTALIANGNPANSTLGWDVTADWLNYSNLKGSQSVNTTVFTNLIVRNWGGEMIKGFGFTGGTSTFIDIANCTFSNGPASALNPDYATHVHGCTFINLNKVQEITQNYWSFPSIFENNTARNISSQGYSVTGAAAGVMQSCTIRSNLFDGANISIDYGANVTISANTFTNVGQDYIDLVGTGAQGTLGLDTNIVVINNKFYPTADASIFFGGMAVSGFHATNNLNATARIQGGSDFPSGFNISPKTNIDFVNNDNHAAPAYSVTVGRIAGDLSAFTEFDFRNTTNSAIYFSGNIPSSGLFQWDWCFGGSLASTNNQISYWMGPYHKLIDANSPPITNAFWYLDDFHSNGIPVGARKVVVNGSTNPQRILRHMALLFAGDYSNPDTLPPGATNIYYWNSGWSTNAPVVVAGPIYAPAYRN